jgi:UTP--glucose-1-phosphate uridylyltransferase
VRQGEPLGLGHAVLIAKHIVGDEPFAVVLGDDVIDATPPALKQMIDVFHRVQGPVVAVERVAPEDVSSYGIVKIDEASDWGRRPSHRRSGGETEARRTPSNLAIIGRYILTPDIFEALETTPATTGEIQLTNGLRQLLEEAALVCVRIVGTRHDTGNKLGS